MAADSSDNVVTGNVSGVGQDDHKKFEQAVKDANIQNVDLSKFEKNLIKMGKQNDKNGIVSILKEKYNLLDSDCSLVATELIDMFYVSAQQQAQQQDLAILDRILIGLEQLPSQVGNAVGNEMKAALREDNINRVMDNISRTTQDEQETFRGLVLHNYGFKSNNYFCMVTGLTGAVEAAHIVPKTAAGILTKELNEGYKNQFDVMYFRNGLIFSHQWHSWFDRRKFSVIYDPLRRLYLVKSFSNVCNTYDGRALFFPDRNGNAVRGSPAAHENAPFHRALKFHFKQCVNKLSETEKKRYNISSDAWESIVDLSDKESVGSSHPLGGSNDNINDDSVISGLQEEKENELKQEERNLLATAAAYHLLNTYLPFAKMSVANWENRGTQAAIQQDKKYDAFIMDIIECLNKVKGLSMEVYNQIMQNQDLKDIETAYMKIDNRFRSFESETDV